MSTCKICWRHHDGSNCLDAFEEDPSLATILEMLNTGMRWVVRDEMTRYIERQRDPSREDARAERSATIDLHVDAIRLAILRKSGWAMVGDGSGDLAASKWVSDLAPNNEPVSIGEAIKTAKKDAGL